MHMKSWIYRSLTLTSLAVLTSCGININSGLQGVAAIGAPLSGASITLKDAQGQTLTTTASASGAYSFSSADLMNMKAPFQVIASVQMGEKLVTHYAVIPSLGNSDVPSTANITPLTTAITGLLTDSGVVTEWNNQQLASLSPAAYQSALTKIQDAVKPLSATLVAGSTDFNPLTTPISQTGKGADLLLDHLDVVVRPDAVNIINKMAVVDSTNQTTAMSQISKDPGVAATPIALAETTNTDGFEELVDQIKKCFQVPHTERLTNKQPTSATLHAECRNIALSDYLHNATPFVVRWAKLFNTETLNTNSLQGGKTKFFRPEVRLRINKSPERIAVNFNFTDNEGNGYTLPEIIQRDPDNGQWRLYGNQRKISAIAEAQLEYYQDLTKGTPYVNTNFSKATSGFRLYLDPRIAFDDTDGRPDYSGVFDLTTATGYATEPNLVSTALKFSTFKNRLPTNQHTVACVVVTGPGKFDQSGKKWMGIYPHGLIMKRSSASATQDYVAIDSRATESQLSALNAIDMNLNYTARSISPQICGTGVTDQGSSNYTIESEALTQQVNPITMQIDSSINGRDVIWNTGPGYARTAPDAELGRIFDNNPRLTYYVISTGNKLAMKFDVRYLGDLPPVSQAKELIAKNKVARATPETLSRFLSWDASNPNRNTVTLASADWSTPPQGFGADLIGFYSQIYRATPGRGLRGSNSKILANQSGVYTDNLWASDEDLAADLDATGVLSDVANNFYWRYSGYAKKPDTTNGCANYTNLTSLISSITLSVGRATTGFTDRVLNGASYHGLDSLDTACLQASGTSPNVVSATHAYLHREVWLRTYTDRNVRFTVTAANKAFRPAP